MSGGSDGWGPPGQNVSGDFLPEPPRDPGLAMVLKNGTRVEFIVPSTDGEIVSGRVLPSSSVGEESLSPNHPDTSSRF